MNSRQRQIIDLLLTIDDKVFITINQIAQTLNCSEKTVRNDFKQIDDWLETDFEAKIIRKPNIGVKLEISEEERKKLLMLNSKVETNQSTHIFDRERKEKILTMLIKNDKALSIQELSEKFFVSRYVIKQDLKEIEAWLDLFKLSLESKRKVGIVLTGDEKNKRAAFLRINQFGEEEGTAAFGEKWFSDYEITKTKQQLRKLEKELNKEYTKDSLNNLVFHVLITVKRIKMNHMIKMTRKELDNLKARKEYDVVKKHIEKLEGPFAMKFPEEEISYILLHVLGSKEKNNASIANNELPLKVHSLLRKLIQKMSQHTNIAHEKDEQLLIGLEIHMKSAFERIEHGLYHINPLLSDIKKTFPYTFATLFHVMEELKEMVGFVFPEDEIGYLTLHFEASKERLKKLDGHNKRAIVVCSMGIGMSQLLTTKIERKFHSLEIIKCVSVDELDDAITEKNPDFVISTIPLEHAHLPVIHVSPLLHKDEEEKIKSFISNLGTVQVTKFESLKKFIDKDLILFKEERSEPNEIIRSLCGLLEKKGFVNENYVNDSLEREKLSPTTIGGEIAIPHGHPKNVLKQAVAIAILTEPIHWKRELVSIVIMLSIKETRSEEIKKLFEEISFLGENKDVMERWKSFQTKDEFYEYLK